MNIKELESTIKMLMRLWAQEKSVQEKALGKIRYSGPLLGPDEYEAMMNAVFNNWWSSGQFTIEAEKKLAQMSNRNNALLTNSGSSANLLLMEAARELYFKPKDKILTLACGFPTTVNTIIQSGLTPVLADINIDTLNLNPHTLQDALKEHNIKGLFLPHTLGFKNDIKVLLDIARPLNIMVFFDACDSYGTKYDGNPIQHYGKAATLSFYVAHHVTMGEGGAVVTNDENLHRVMKGLRSWGKHCSSENCCVRSLDPTSFCPTTRLTLDAPIPGDYPVNYIYEWIGYNLKPLELQSAILCRQLDRLEEFNGIRRANYLLIQNYLKQSKFQFKIWDLDKDVSPFVFPFIIPENAPFTRKHIVDYLKRNKIETRVLFGGNLTRHPAFYKNKDSFIQFQNLTNSDLIMERGLLLGVSQINDLGTTQKMIDVIDTFLQKY